MIKKELIAELFIQFEQAAYEYKGIECWSARELQQIFAYADWRNFLKVAEKAKAACENAGEKVSDHFVDVNKMIDLAKGAQREIEDIALTRYACYLIAQNGDPDFANEPTSHNVIDKDLRGEIHISKEHIDNNLAVRRMLKERGVQPEALPPAEDLKKVSRRIDSDGKKINKLEKKNDDK